MVEVSALDRAHYEAIRGDVVEFLQRHAANYDRPDARVLDVAPQDHAGAGPAFVRSAVETLDLDPASGATYIADLCRCNEALIPDGSFDVVVCTEVLEHVAQPFDAVAEIRRVLKPAGVASVTTPFNFRIHGPLPDCWRFSGTRAPAVVRAIRDRRAGRARDAGARPHADSELARGASVAAPDSGGSQRGERWPCCDLRAGAGSCTMRSCRGYEVVVHRERNRVAGQVVGVRERTVSGSC